MARCTRQHGLEIHHRRRDGGSELANAQVLCRDCYVARLTYGVPGVSPPPFSLEVRDVALGVAGWRCECVSGSGCH